MLEQLKKSLYTSFGFAILTKEKIEKMVDDLVEKGKLSEKEGKAFVEELVSKSRESSQEFENKINEKVRESLKKMEMVTQDDLKSLERRVAKLEKQSKSQKSSQ